MAGSTGLADFVLYPFQRARSKLLCASSFHEPARSLCSLTRRSKSEQVRINKMAHQMVSNFIWRSITLQVWNYFMELDEVSQGF